LRASSASAICKKRVDLHGRAPCAQIGVDRRLERLLLISAALTGILGFNGQRQARILYPVFSRVRPRRDGPEPAHRVEHIAIRFARAGGVEHRLDRPLPPGVAGADIIGQ
jgi:hypothetical protein